MSIEKADTRFPCDKRNGYARPCKCQKDQENGKNPDMFWCDLYDRNVYISECRDCNYRERKFGPANN